MNKAEKVQNDANVKTAQSSIDKIKDEMAEAPAASGGAVDYGQYAQAPAPSAPSNGGNATAPTNPPTHNGGGNTNSNVGLDEANDLDHASNGENSIDGGR